MTVSTSEFHWPVRVYWEDTDASGIVYHANYLKFLERGRSEWLRALEFMQSEIANDDRIGFVVRHMAIDFLKPAMLDDELDVNCRVIKVRGASVEMSQIVSRDDDELVRAVVKVACMNLATLRPARIPADFAQKIAD